MQPAIVRKVLGEQGPFFSRTTGALFAIIKTMNREAVESSGPKDAISEVSRLSSMRQCEGNRCVLVRLNVRVMQTGASPSPVYIQF